MSAGSTNEMTWADVAALGEQLRGVVPSTSYGTPALKVGRKVLARLVDDGATIVLRAPLPVRDHLLATAPGTFHVTDHYRDYPLVLVRLAHADRTQIAELLESAWRAAAPTRLVDGHDAGTAGA
jgi:hypothetical protein